MDPSVAPPKGAPSLPWLRHIGATFLRLRSVLGPLVLFTVSLGIAVAWTWGGSLPIGGDTPPVVDAQLLLTHYSSIWDWWGNLGYSSPPILTGLDPPLVVFLGAADTVGLSFSTAYTAFLLVFLFVGALATEYVARGLIVTYRMTTRIPLAGLLYLITPFWFFQGAGDVASLSYSTGAVALVLWSLVYCRGRTGIVTVLLPAATMLTLTNDFPFSIPRILGLCIIVIVFDLFLLVTRQGRPRRAFGLTARMALALLAALACTTYLWTSLPIALGSYSAHTQTVSTLYPLTGYRAYAAQVGFALRGMNSWGMFNPSYNGLAWMSFYLENPLGVLSTFAIPSLAWFALLNSRNWDPRVRGIRTLVALGLLIVVFAGTGTTLPGSTWLWGIVTSLPQGTNLFAASVSTSFVPFSILASALLAADTLSTLVVATERGRARARASPDRAQQSTLLKLRGHNVRLYAPLATALAICICLVAAGAIPTIQGEKGEWHTDTAQGSGVSLPTTYSAANSWLGANDRSGGNVLVLPLPGEWPTLNWSNGSGYQGYNPYQELFPAVPVIDGSVSPSGDTGGGALSIYSTAALYAIQSPGLLAALRPPSEFGITLLNQSTNLAGSTAGWSNGRCTPCGTVTWNSTISGEGQIGGVQFNANSSWGATNPNKNNLFLDVGNFSLANVSLAYFWLNSSATVLDDLRLGVEDSNGSIEWEPVRPSAIKDPWAVLLINLTQGWPAWSISNATNLVLNFPSESTTGITEFIVGTCRLASSRAILDGSNQASLTSGWSVPYPSGETLNWSTVGMPGSPGSVELETSSNTSFGNPNGDGLTYTLAAPANLSTFGGIELWFQVQGVPPSQVSVGFGYQGGQIAWYRTNPTVPFAQAIPLGDWDEMVVPFENIAPSALDQVRSVDIFFVPSTPSPAIDLRIGFLGVIPPATPNGTLAAALFHLLGARYLVVDSALGPAAVSIEQAYSEMFKVTPSFTDGTLEILATSGSWTVPVYATGRVFAATSVYEVLRDEVDGDTNDSYCLTGSPCSAVNSSSEPDVLATTAPDFSSGTPITAEVLGPGLLVLPQLYSTVWFAEAGGRVLPHVEVDGLSNGWVLAPGVLNVTIELLDQPLYTATLIVSLVTSGLICALSVVLLVVPDAGRGIGRRLRRSITALKRVLLTPTETSRPDPKEESYGGPTER